MTVVNSEFAEQKLHEAVKHLYAILGNYVGSPNWSDCLDTRPEEYTTAPARKSVDELSSEQVSDFFHHAVCHHEKHERILAVKYFLPRVFKIITAASDNRPFGGPFQPYFIARELAAANWKSFKLQERIAIEQLLSAWWQATLAWNGWRNREIHWELNRPPASRSARELIIEVFMVCENPFEPRLNDWRQNNSIEAALQLAEFVLYLAPKFSWGRMPTATNSDIIGDEQWATLQDWLTNPQTVTQLERAFFRAPDQATAKKLSDAVAMIEPLASGP